MLVFREQYLRRFIFVYAELWVCCSWDNKLSQVCPLFFDQMPGSCSYLTCKVGFENSISPFTCILYGKCFGISVTHLTSDLEVPGSSPGVSNNFFFFTFFSFWPFTLPSPLNIKTRTIANNVINNHIYFIITYYH